MLKSLLPPRTVAALARPALTASFAWFAFVGALLGSSPVAYAQNAQAPVSDADRAAARELATQGIQLQEAGNFADALDRFDRAQAVFSAPTHLLHIAECEAALGKLVESAETYRTLVRTPLPAGAPAAFVQAQQQGAAELAQVEPRIPSIRVLVRPRVIPNTTIQIDGQPVSAALVGVQRPTDPGTHSIVLLAPGYARTEQRIVLAEKETKDVAFNLGGSPGYTAPASGTTQPPSTSTQPPPPLSYGAQPYDGTRYGGQPYGVQPNPNAPEEGPARGGFMLGVMVGALVPAGGLSTTNSNAGYSLNDYASGGAAVGLSGGFRFVRRLYLGLAYEHGFLGAGSALTANGGTGSADSNYIGAEFAYMSNPDGTAAFFAKLGAGYRFVDFSVQNGGDTLSSTYSGGEGSLGVGVEIKLGGWVRLVPQLTVSVGQFSTASTSTSGSTSGGNNQQTTIESSGSISDPNAHVFALFGLATFIDFARKH